LTDINHNLHESLNSGREIWNIPKHDRPIRILRLPEVIARIGLCRASIYKRMAQGSFPKPIALGIRARGWLEHEIAAWVNVRIQARAAAKK